MPRRLHPRSRLPDRDSLRNAGFSTKAERVEKSYHMLSHMVLLSSCADLRPLPAKGSPIGDRKIIRQG